ncbi:MAG: hypothetical protein Q4G52_08610 [Clostridia bacterium]|nr:hypothetical protein [Clostridia bacterium]
MHPITVPYAKAQAELAARIREAAARCVRPVAAIDGMAASGKTTLAHALAREIPGCAVVSMDDFFLPPGRRAERERLLANADIERFDAEVLLPLSQGREAVYRPFVCHPEPAFAPPVRIPAQASCVIVEGAYCLHPALFGRYALRALCLISPEEQKRRIAARNGEAMLSRFVSEWIPLENRHIEARNLIARCDLLIREGPAV